MDAAFFDTPIDRRGTASFKWDMYDGDVLPLWVADMDFASPPPVVEALEAVARRGVLGYALAPDSLAEAVAGHLERRYGWRIDPGWIAWLPGIVPGLNLACDAFAAPGEAILTVTPVYPPFLEAPGHRGRRLITVPAGLRDGRWQLPLDAMEAAVTPDTRVLFFCHPHNPLGRVWRGVDVETVLDFCRRHDLVLVSDEIHCDLVLDDLVHIPSALAGPDDQDRIVTFMSPSKTFNLPGLNLAFAVVADEELRRRLLQPGEGLLPFPGCFAVAAAEAAYRHGGDWHAGLLDYLRGNRDALEAFVAAELPRVRMTHVEATYLAWLDVRALGLEDPAAACRSAGVALSAGAAFGDPACLRLNFGCRRETLDEALRRLVTVLR
ncbi:MAG TPA: PatB family C-S lyase [Thermoleophilia bacterium]|nr:PatB family C-S lyase [Thermoleophilia bacterium]